MQFKTNKLDKDQHANFIGPKKTLFDYNFTPYLVYGFFFMLFIGFVYWFYLLEMSIK